MSLSVSHRTDKSSSSDCFVGSSIHTLLNTIGRREKMHSIPLSFRINFVDARVDVIANGQYRSAFSGQPLVIFLDNKVALATDRISESLSQSLYCLIVHDIGGKNPGEEQPRVHSTHLKFVTICRCFHSEI